MKSKLKILSIIIIMALVLGACSSKAVETTASNKVDSRHEDVIQLVKDNEYLMENYPDLFPVNRTTEGIVLESQKSIKLNNATYDMDFYRNTAYDAGLEGKYTFLVINPANNPDKEAPLWVYFHGGAAGYFAEDGSYQANWHQDEMSWNKEETYNSMMNTLSARVYYNNGMLRDNTLVRRLREGYRMLVVSYSDHDTYLGVGNEYPNNPIGGEVNGLQASMSAVDFVTTHYLTNYVYAHGSSAGAFGAYALGVAYHMEGINLTGIVSDSGVPVPEIMTLWDYYAGQPDDWFTENWESKAMMEKVGPFGDMENKLLAEDMIEKGFDVPILGIGGKEDHWFRAYFPVMDTAIESGFENNADWVYNNLISVIEQQESSPHKIILIDDAGHVPTIKGPVIASDYVDDFIQSSIEYNSAYPFDKLNTNDQVETNTSLSLDLSFTNPPFDLGNIDATFAQDVSYDEYDETKFDIFLPNSEEPTGLVIYIHGGGFKTGDKSKLYASRGDQNLIKELLSENIAVASINYRLVTEDDEDGILKCLNDSKRALQFIRCYNDDFNIRKEDVALMGGSAGSGTSLWIAVNDDMKDINNPDPVLRESTRVKGIAVSGVQATYDFALWSSVVFAEFDMDIDDMAALSNDTNDTPMYGSISYMELESLEVIEYRKKVDMLSQITADDPEIWASSTGTSNGAPQTQSDRNHHGYHVKAIKEKADEVGVDMMCEYGNPLLYQSENFESKVDFLIRKVNE